MNLKRIAAIALIEVLLLSQSIPAYAQVPQNALPNAEGSVSISPLWANINDIQLDLYFESGNACCAGIINALSGTTRVLTIFFTNLRIQFTDVHFVIIKNKEL